MKLGFHVYNVAIQYQIKFGSSWIDEEWNTGDKLDFNVIESDRDHDGTPDSEDAFPDNPNEQKDADGDGVGDNSDVFPNDPLEWKDSDSDGVGDNSDVFPNDPLEWKDSDSDGVGDNSDTFPTIKNSYVYTGIALIVIVIAIIAIVIFIKKRKSSIPKQAPSQTPSPSNIKYQQPPSQGTQQTITQTSPPTPSEQTQQIGPTSSVSSHNTTESYNELKEKYDKLVEAIVKQQAQEKKMDKKEN